MRIKSVEIKNHKSFLGTYKINMAGKNLFIYGENGSGRKNDDKGLTPVLQGYSRLLLMNYSQDSPANDNN